MRVCGIIAEYDPFHLGHDYQLRRARELSGAEYVICVISTVFTQRGLPALFATRARADMALACGADLVLGMPVSYSCAQANRFALGGVGILHALQVVSHLSFGVEAAALPHLEEAAALLNDPGEGFQRALKSALKEGKSLARAQGDALHEALPELPAGTMQRPNFILGLAYLQALRRLKSDIQPLVIPRSGDYHASALEPLPSATAVRAAILRGDWQGIERALPAGSYAILSEAVKRHELHLPGTLDALLIARLLDGAAEADIAEMSEGLEQRIRRLARKSGGREELTSLVRSKRYPYARVSRALSGALLRLKKAPDEPPAYARLLGFRREAAPLLRAIDRGGFPLVSRPARDERLDQDMRAEALWYLGAGQPPEQAYRQKITIL